MRRVDAHAKHRADGRGAGCPFARPQLARRAVRLDFGDRSMANAGDVVAARPRIVVDALRPECRVGQASHLSTPRDRRSVRAVCCDDTGKRGQHDKGRKRSLGAEIASESEAGVRLQRMQGSSRVSGLRREDRLGPEVRRLKRPRFSRSRHLVTRAGDVVFQQCLRRAAPRGARDGGGIDRGKTAHRLTTGMLESEQRGTYAEHREPT
jgi:hypothetical protein